MAVSENLEALGEVAKFSPNIEIKGYRSGLALIIPEQGSFETYLEQLEARLKSSNNFFNGAKISVELGQRELNEAEYQQLVQIFQGNGLILRKAAERVNKKVAVKKKNDKDSVKVVSSITVNQTLRSGQRVEYSGNVIICGDVNPGAEVIATGDIMVLGKLRGTAHAGVEGNEQARIFAFQISPVQLRIAGSIARGAERVKNKRVKDNRPELAIVKDGQIIVEQYKL